MADRAAWRPEVVETHVSLLVLLGDRAYKLRKPVRYGFVDFTSREEREADCRREVCLNRPYAPDVYLGVYDVVADGRPVDHLVVMRRLPSDRSLSALVRRGRARPAHLEAVVERLLAADRAAARSPSIDAWARPEALLEGWRQNAREVAPFVGGLLDAGEDGRIQELASSYLSGRTALFDERIAAGRVRDGHGDLRAEDVYCLEDGARILDCVEFDERLRACDVVSDVAFLAMDLERLGDRQLASELVRSYAAVAGDAFPPSLLAYYGGSHAYVRAKVACLSAEAGARGAGALARALHGLSAELLQRARVRLVLVGGLPGSGKSTLANLLGPALEAEVVHSDETRKGLARDRSVAGGDLYGAAMTEATYGELLRRARAALGRGGPVVLDASWHAERFRRAARAVARETASELLELRCEAPAVVAERRIGVRRRAGVDASDATVEVARAMARAADPWPEARAVDTSGDPSAALAGALDALGGTPA